MSLDSLCPDAPVCSTVTVGRPTLRRTLCRLGFWYFCTWPLGTALFWLWSPAAGISHFIATHVLALYSALRANSQVFGDVVQRFETSQREVWLTIDDGPFAGDTNAILEVLAKHQAHATFFLEGARVSVNPALVRDITAAGHSVGNHTQHHRVSRFWAAGPWTAARELGACTAALSAAAQASPLGFRPPVGMANGFVHLIARQQRLPVIGWDVRGYDGLDTCPDRVARRILSAVRPGSIILLHQRSGSTDTSPRNAATLERVLTELTAAGYRCVLPAPERYIAG